MLQNNFSVKFFSYKNSSHVIGYLLSQTELELQTTTRNEKQLTVRLDSGKNVFLCGNKKEKGAILFLVSHSALKSEKSAALGSFIACISKCKINEVFFIFHFLERTNIKVT